MGYPDYVTSFLMLMLIVGFSAGILSGTFGIGGGILTTPAIRLLLGYPAQIAVGTPLLLSILPAMVAVYNYNRNKLISWDVVPAISIFGLLGVIVGAGLTAIIDARFILLITAAVILAVSTQFLRPRKSGYAERLPSSRFGPYSIGTIAGLYSGFLGLGGGIVLVPMLNLWLKKDIKTSFGTSLALVVIFSIPGSLVHYLLGHVDLLLALVVSAGAVPGAYIGSYLVTRIDKEKLRFSFGLLLVIAAIYMAIFELVDLGL